MYRAGGPLAQAIISARRAHELHRANREEKKKKTLPKGSKHAALPRRKSRHRTMRDTPSAIRSADISTIPCPHGLPYWGYPESCGFEAAATVGFRVVEGTRSKLEVTPLRTN